MTTGPELRMRSLLKRMGVSFVEQQKVAGHKIDFVVPCGDYERLLLIEPNGDRWHRWSKIIDCDRTKLNRVLAEGAIPMGVWASRLIKQELFVEVGIWSALKQGRMPWWDWAVDPRSLSPRAREVLMWVGPSGGVFR